MIIGSMFFSAPTPDEARRFFAENETEALEISLPITPDPIPPQIRRNIFDCGRQLPGRVALHEVLPLALAHRQADFRARLANRIRDDLALAGEAGVAILTLHTTCTRSRNERLETHWKLPETLWLARAMDQDVTEDFTESVRVLVKLLRDLAPLAQAGGVAIALENNFRDEKYFGRRLDAVADILDALDEAHAPQTGVCFDIYKAFSTEPSLADSIRACSGRLVNVHASDIEHLDTAFHHRRRVIGEGRIDWRAVIAALRDINYHGPVILEMMGADANVRASARRLRELAREAGYGD